MQHSYIKSNQFTVANKEKRKNQGNKTHTYTHLRIQAHKEKKDKVQKWEESTLLNC